MGVHFEYDYSENPKRRLHVGDLVEFYDAVRKENTGVIGIIKNILKDTELEDSGYIDNTTRYNVKFFNEPKYWVYFEPSLILYTKEYLRKLV